MIRDWDQIASEYIAAWQRGITEISSILTQGDCDWANSYLAGKRDTLPNGPERDAIEDLRLIFANRLPIFEDESDE